MNIYKCHYGCGRDAIKQNKSGNWMCDTFASKCPINRMKNSAGVTKGHSENRIPGWNSLALQGKANRAWKKGLTKNDPRVAKNTSALRAALKGRPGRPHSSESKKKMSDSRLNIIAEGRHDSSGRKGHRGHYNGVYFHSSWELAYYVYQTEVLNRKVTRNTNKYDYISGEKLRITIPDFVLDDQLIIEIKGYLYSECDHDKFKQTSDKIKYLFKDDIQECLDYCITKYGQQFWKVLYG